MSCQDGTTAIIAFNATEVSGPFLRLERGFQAPTATVAFNAKETLKKVANGSINRKNLKALLYFLDSWLR